MPPTGSRIGALPGRACAGERDLGRHARSLAHVATARTAESRSSIRDKPISIAGVTYPRGIGTRSISEFVIDLDGQALRFASLVGLDDVVKDGVGSVTFEVWADDTLVAESGMLRAGDAPKILSADLKGRRVLTLLVDDGGDTSNDDEVAWAGAHIILEPGATSTPRPYVAPPEPPPAVAPVRNVPQPEFTVHA